MTKFRITDTIQHYVDYTYIVEADNEDEARDKYEAQDCEHEATDIGEIVDGGDSEVQIEEIDDDDDEIATDETRSYGPQGRIN